MKATERGRWIRILDVVLIVSLVAAILAGVFYVASLRRHSQRALSALTNLEVLSEGGNAVFAEILQDPSRQQSLYQDLLVLDRELAAIESLTRPFLPVSSALGWVPWIGADLKAAPHLLVISRSTLDAVLIVAKLLEPLITTDDQQGIDANEQIQAVVQALASNRTAPDRARQAIEVARIARSQVRAEQLSGPTREILDRFDQYEPALDLGLQSLEVLPGALGAYGPRTYLVLAQNNHELRATGGFISGIGLVTVDDGQITELSFQDSYTVDDLSQPHPLPPEGLRRHMGAGMLLLRDANWWPDFPTTAQAAANLYEQDQRRSIDGVIAVDLVTLDLLLQALGPIRVPGYDEPISSHNLESMIMTYWQAPLQTAPGKSSTDWWKHRKDLASDLMAALVDGVFGDLKATEAVSLAQAMGTALAEDHLLVYVRDPHEQGLLVALGWDGGTRQPPGDYLMVVDSNVGFNKVNPNVEQVIDYEVEIDDTGVVTAELGITYQHLVQRPTPACLHESYYGEGYQDLMERCYWDHVRIYVPQGSQLLAIDGADEPAQVYTQAGKTVIATSFLLENGSTRRIQIRYRPMLPDVNAGSYSLLVQKQPGTLGSMLRIRLALPEGTTPVEASPQDLMWVPGQAIWQGDLGRDQSLHITWD